MAQIATGCSKYLRIISILILFIVHNLIVKADSDQVIQSILNNKVTKESLYKYLEKTNQLDDVANVFSFLARNHDEEIELFLKKLWSLDKKDAENLDWNVISKPLPRIAIAQTLARRSNCFEYDEYHSYIVQNLSSSDINIQIASISALGLIGTDNDIKKLVSIVNENVTTIAVVSLHALELIGTKNSYDTLIALSKQSHIKENAQVWDTIVEIISRFNENKSVLTDKIKGCIKE